MCIRDSLNALQQAIVADRARGLTPFLVTGTAGTVDTGAIDDLAGIAELCAEHQLWFHVDGAYGALAMLAPELAPRLKGIQQADSLAFDFHKWAQVPYDAGFLLVRDGTRHQQAFVSTCAYLTPVSYTHLDVYKRQAFDGDRTLFARFGEEVEHHLERLQVPLFGKRRSFDYTHESDNHLLQDIHRVGCQHCANCRASDGNQFRWLDKDAKFSLFHEKASDDAGEDKKNSNDREHSLFLPVQPVQTVFSATSHRISLR